MEKKAPSLTSLLTSWTTPTSGKVGLAKLSDEKEIDQNQERPLIKMEGGLPDQIWRGRSKREKGRVIQVEGLELLQRSKIEKGSSCPDADQCGDVTIKLFHMIRN